MHLSVQDPLTIVTSGVVDRQSKRSRRGGDPKPVTARIGSAHPGRVRLALDRGREHHRGAATADRRVPSRHVPSDAMTIFWFTLPLMALGVAIAVLPMTINSLRHGRSLPTGAEDTHETAAGEAAFWNHHLRCRQVRPGAVPVTGPVDQGRVAGTPLGTPRT